MKVGMIHAVKWTTYAVENELETWSYMYINFAVQNISNFISTIRYIMCTVVGTHLTEVKKVMMKLSYMYTGCKKSQFYSLPFGQAVASMY